MQFHLRDSGGRIRAACGRDTSLAGQEEGSAKFLVVDILEKIGKSEQATILPDGANLLV
jgi:hypothetical protein